jgi:hypothetical protein
MTSKGRLNLEQLIKEDQLEPSVDPANADASSPGSGSAATVASEARISNAIAKAGRKRRGSKAVLKDKVKEKLGGASPTSAPGPKRAEQQLEKPSPKDPSAVMPSGTEREQQRESHSCTLVRHREHGFGIDLDDDAVIVSLREPLVAGDPSCPQVGWQLVRVGGVAVHSKKDVLVALLSEACYEAAEIEFVTLSPQQSSAQPAQTADAASAPTTSVNLSIDVDPAAPAEHIVEEPANSVEMSTEGVVLVDVLKGHGLMPVDSNGKADPYVVLRCAGGKAQQTEVVKKTLQPVWASAHFQFQGIRLADALVAEVFDWDRFGKHSPMGQVLVPVAGENEPLCQHSLHF